MKILSRNRVRGKDVNEAIKARKTVKNKRDNAYLRVGSESAYVDEDHTYMLRLKHDGPILGIDEDKKAAVAHLDEAFWDDEEFDARTEDGRILVLTKGRDEYRFPLWDNDSPDPKLPSLPDGAVFELDSKELKKALDKASKDPNAVVKIHAAQDKDGKDRVFAFVYNGKDVLLACVKLGSWTGPMDHYESMYRAHLMNRILMDGGTADMSSDYPITIRRKGAVDRTFVLAPLIVDEDHPDHSDEELLWVSSHSRRPRRPKEPLARKTRRIRRRSA